MANLTESSLSVHCSLDVEQSRNSSPSHLLPVDWQKEQRVVVHVSTHYLCEVWDASSSHLLANATTAASPTFLRPGA